MRTGQENTFLDPRLWNDLQRRDDDVLINTYCKFGHLRMQFIVQALLQFSAGQSCDFLPWVELRHPKSAERIERLNADQGRHILRSHLPADIIYNNLGKYIFVGRDPRDLVFNIFHFLKSADQKWYDHFKDGEAPIIRPSGDFKLFWENWMEGDGSPLWSYFNHLHSWWEKRHQPNVLLVHFFDFKSNMEKELGRISEFLELNITANDWPALFELCRYERISEICQTHTYPQTAFWNGGDAFHQGQAPTPMWQDLLTDGHQADLENKVRDLLGAAGEKWLFKTK